MALQGGANREGRQGLVERAAAGTEDKLRRASANRISLLVVDDEQPLARLWAGELAHLVEVTLAGSLAEARSKLSSRGFDAVLLDLNLPDGNGTELLREIASRDEETAVIILTGNADLNSAIQAVRYGAYDYLIKPCRVVEIEQHIERIAQQRRLRDENVALKQTLAPQRVQAELVGTSPQLVEVRRLVGRVAPTNTSVLLTGDTGTGKEVTARMIHQLSQRREGAFIPVNCAALPKELAESELFGHRKGSFTGADRDHRGLVLAASGGTLFLDEIGDLPLDTQAKFLRLLESAEARRVGDTEAYRTDVRVVAATNRDLKRDVADGRFRQDLFYRLTTFELRLPALREIPQDIPLIAEHMLRITTVAGCRATGFDPLALTALQQYDWPGNVRELRNVIERAMILCEGETIRPEHLNLPAASGESAAVPFIGAQATIAEVEWRMVQDALKRYQGNKTAAARALGISLRTLYNKLDAHENGTRSEDETEVE
ncbi:MAG: sigma-54 dependent transcriptional regulator [Tepidisphaeraceae bacterium]|jgi:DNA-binding NtrC family response regulator